jgi:beta-mannosidase
MVREVGKGRKIACVLFVLISFIAVDPSALAQSREISLGSDSFYWQFRNINDATWHKATVPGTVHTDLLNNTMIPDPYFVIMKVRCSG